MSQVVLSVLPADVCPEQTRHGSGTLLVDLDPMFLAGDWWEGSREEGLCVMNGCRRGEGRNESDETVRC